MKMVGGDFILRDKAPCFVQPSATFVCVFLEKGEMVEETMLVQEGVNGSMTEVEWHPFRLGERLGFQYGHFKHKFIFILCHLFLCVGLNLIWNCFFHAAIWLIWLVRKQPNAPRVLAPPFFSSYASRFMLCPPTQVLEFNIYFALNVFYILRSSCMEFGICHIDSEQSRDKKDKRKVEQLELYTLIRWHMNTYKSNLGPVYWS